MLYISYIIFVYLAYNKILETFIISIHCGQNYNQKSCKDMSAPMLIGVLGNLMANFPNNSSIANKVKVLGKKKRWKKSRPPKFTNRLDLK